jgi:hypothetical protein
MFTISTGMHGDLMIMGALAEYQYTTLTFTTRTFALFLLFPSFSYIVLADTCGRFQALGILDSFNIAPRARQV